MLINHRNKLEKYRGESEIMFSFVVPVFWDQRIKFMFCCKGIKKFFSVLRVLPKAHLEENN
jgi:hypothetical protein